MYIIHMVGGGGVPTPNKTDLKDFKSGSGTQNWCLSETSREICCPLFTDFLKSRKTKVTKIRIFPDSPDVLFGIVQDFV
jgi:hypothetical protein